MLRDHRWRAMQPLKDVALGRCAILECQFDAGQDGRFVVLPQQGEDADHLAVARGGGDRCRRTAARLGAHQISTKQNSGPRRERRSARTGCKDVQRRGQLSMRIFAARMASAKLRRCSAMWSFIEAAP